VHTSDEFAFRSGHAAQKEMAELAFSLLTMRANTPPGSWVDDEFADAYRGVRAEARSLAGREADEDLFLSVLNLSETLLRYLAAATGIGQDQWLARLHEHYIEPIDVAGVGVWGPRELEI
jgi:hypothetical protein